MKRRFILYRRKTGGIFYVQDTETRKQESLGTRDRADAMTLVNARNESARQPRLNLQIARTYLAASDPEVAKRTWRVAFEELARNKSGATRERWQYAVRDRAFDLIRELPLLDTHAEQLFRVIEAGTVSTNVFLRRVHNFAVDVGWLPWALIPKSRWPRLKFRDKRAITWAEHQSVIAREVNPEWRAYYELLWHIGASQSDLARLQAEDVNWKDQTIAYARLKTGSIACLSFGEGIAEVLRRLATTGPLFPRLSEMHEKHRAKQFSRRCQQLGLRSVSLHSYRYAWAERAKEAGYPERFAQEALGHNSKAIHRSYARKARVKLPSLESYEEHSGSRRVLPFPTPVAAGAPDAPSNATVP